MSELLITVLVVLGTGLLVVAIFYLTGAKKKEREKKLAEYCRDRGYTFFKTNEPTKKEYIIKGDNFSFTTTLALLHHDAGSDNDSWGRETVWNAATGDINRPSFALGSIPAGSWELLPDLIKRAAVDRLSHETGLQLEISKAKVLEVEGETTFLLFENKPGEGKTISKRIGPCLKGWPAKYTLFIHSSPDRAQIRLADCFVQEVDLLDKILRLGEAVGGRD